MENYKIIFLFVLLIVAATIDLRKQKIPNIITYPGMLIALVYNTIIYGTEGFFFSAIGIASGIALLIIPYLMGGMGAGDAKLLGAIGGIIGAKAILFAFILTAVVGGIYAIILTSVYRSKFKSFFKTQFDTLLNFMLMRTYFPGTKEKIVNDRPKLCYGLSIALGTGIYIFLKMNGYTNI